MLQLISIPTPFSVGPVNVYLSKAEPLTLVDTGPKWHESRTALEAALAAHGVRLENIQQLILTHHHVDHVGLAGEIVARSGCAVLMHPYNVPWLENYEAERQRHLPFYRRVWQAGGLPENVIAAIEDSGHNMARWLDSVTPTQLIEEGATVNLDGDAWQVFHTPGHAGGLVCLWQAARRDLLANDHFIRDISSNAILEPPDTMNGPRPKRLVEYTLHMQRMAALAPARALPGHGDMVEDVSGLVRQRLAFHERRKQRLLSLLAAQPLTLWELTQTTFRDRLTRGMDWFLGCSEILGHLDLLEADGAVQVESDGTVLRYTPTRNN